MPAQDEFTFEHVIESAEKFLCGDGFDQEACGACDQRSEKGPALGIARQHDDRQLGQNRFELGRALDPGHVGQADIHNHSIGSILGNPVQGLRTGVKGIHHCEMSQLAQILYQLMDVLLVIDDRYSAGRPLVRRIYFEIPHGGRGICSPERDNLRPVVFAAGHGLNQAGYHTQATKRHPDWTVPQAARRGLATGRDPKRRPNRRTEQEAI